MTHATTHPLAEQTPDGSATAPRPVVEESAATVRFPGIPVATDGTGAVVAMETAASEAAGAYPITPSTQMGEGWAAAVAEGRLNVNGRRLVFFEPEGEHAAAGVTAGMAMVGLRAANFSSGQGIAYMHESLYAAVGKRLTYVLNMACRAMTKHALNVHAGHDDYHAIDDTGFFQLFAKDAQAAADLNLIAHRIAELALTPGVCAQDGFLTSHVIESIRLPERELVREYLGDPADEIESPTPAQRLIFGARRRRIPQMFDVDAPTMIGVVQNQDSYAQGVAAQRPFFFAHVAELAERAMTEYAALTGRRYRRAAGYRTDDAELVIVGQGSVVGNAEALADWLRSRRGLAVGVVDVTMFRPFPADRIVELLAGKRAVLVLERLDQPLAVDGPLLREIRAAMTQAMENARAVDGRLPYPDLPSCTPERVPDFYAGCFGMGSRDLQAGDLLAAVDNMLPGAAQRRRFYLGIEFVPHRPRPAGDDWPDRVLEAYPEVRELALEPAENVDLLPASALAVRIHSIGGWGAITMGKNLTMTLFDLLGLQVKSNPKYGSEKKGQPTTFYGVFAREPVRINCELKHVDVVLSPDPNVFRHSDPLAGLAEGGSFVIQSQLAPGELWASFPAWAQERIRRRRIRVFHLDAFGIARAETAIADLQFRMQGAAFHGAFFRVAPILAAEGIDEPALFAAVRQQLEKKFGHRGTEVVEDNLRVIRRGYEEVAELDGQALPDHAARPAESAERIAWRFDERDTGEGMSDPFRFLCQVCTRYRQGDDPLADPFAAVSAIPAATGVLRDMTGIRFEVPELVAARCTGCGQCWTQCPDAAIPGLVTDVGDLLATARRTALAGSPGEPGLTEMLPEIEGECRRLLREEKEFTGFPGVFARAFDCVASRRGEEGRGAAIVAEADRLAAVLADFPVARTAPFFTVPERRAEGSGGLLAVTINPYACKGCNLCVEVCPDEALVSVPQDESVVARLRRAWSLWEALPDTPERFVQVGDLDQGIGVLHTLLLEKEIFHSMVGGDGSCMGCGEKTAIHLVVAAVEAAVRPRVAAFLARLDELVAGVEAKRREVLLAGARLTEGATEGSAHLDLEVAAADRPRLARLNRLRSELEDLRWRYTSGPAGRGRAALGISNSTGCSSVWGSTYPFNPYPYPWVNHLFQDAPSVAIGLFEGIMRKMADGFATVRQAELEIADAFDPARHGPFFEAFDWQSFSDEEYRLCPPLLVVGGDGAMLDIGFQNVSRLLASGKPIKVVVLDTQVYSNTGGQACTSGFLGQVSDMAAYGRARHGKVEQRKEMSLIAMAHRGAFVLQSSQASPAHLISGVLRGLASRRPAVFNLYTPCQAEHGLPDSGSAAAAKLALESRAFPYLLYDPDGGASFPERLSLDGNPALSEDWPAYEVATPGEDGRETTGELRLTTADWAATEPRFARHFRVPADEESERLLPLAEYLALAPAERDERVPVIVVVEPDGSTGRRAVSAEMVALTEDRLELWNELRELAGERVSPAAERRVGAHLEPEIAARLAALRTEYEAKIAEIERSVPAAIAHRLARAMVEGRGPFATLAAASGAMAAEPIRPLREVEVGRPPARSAAPQPAAVPPAASSAEPVASPVAVASAEATSAGLEPWIESELCTSCDECTRLNPRMFAYDENKQAFIKDPRAGTFQQLVLAAERCTARIIHPGTPLDPNEPDLGKWVERAAPFA